MQLTFTVGEGDARATFAASLDAPVELARPLDFAPDGEQVRAFWLPRATATPFRAGDFVGSVAEGGPVNCAVLTLAPHGNGTHTESVGHITTPITPVCDAPRGTFFPAAVVRVTAQSLVSSGESYPLPSGASADGEQVITAAALQAALDRIATREHALPSGAARALVVQCAHDAEAERLDWSGANPPYLTTEAMRLVRAWSTEHLLVTVPSVDREEDGGALPNHRTFWDVAPGVTAPNPDRAHCTITELVQDVGLEGWHLLELQLPRLMTDAAPSRPRLHLIRRV